MLDIFLLFTAGEIFGYLVRFSQMRATHTMVIQLSLCITSTSCDVYM